MDRSNVNLPEEEEATIRKSSRVNKGIPKADSIFLFPDLKKGKKVEVNGPPDRQERESDGESSILSGMFRFGLPQSEVKKNVRKSPSVKSKTSKVTKSSSKSRNERIRLAAEIELAEINKKIADQTIAQKRLQLRQAYIISNSPFTKIAQNDISYNFC